MMGWLRRLLGSEKGDESFGRRGENAAARHLRGQGYRILLRNFNTPVGEIDIIAREGKTVVFVEVKTRAEDDPMPEANVDAAKQHQLTRAAKHFLSRYGTPQPAARFDVVAVVWPSGAQPRIRHTMNAFDATF